MMSDMPFEHVTVGPERTGVPCIRNLRVNVTMVLWHLAAGTIEQLLADYPYLERGASKSRIEVSRGTTMSVAPASDTNWQPVASG